MRLTRLPTDIVRSGPSTDTVLEATAETLAEVMEERDRLRAERDQLPAAAEGMVEIYARFRHLDGIIRDCKNSDDPIHRALFEMWSVIKANLPEDFEEGGEK